MKKISLVLALVFCFGSIAFADCEIDLAWTPDPLAVSQEVWHNPDGVLDNGDEVSKASGLAAAIQSYSWIDTGVCPSSNTVYVVTEFTGGVTSKSAEFAVLDAVGAILNNAVRIPN